MKAQGKNNQHKICLQFGNSSIKFLEYYYFTVKFTISFLDVNESGLVK